MRMYGSHNFNGEHHILVDKILENKWVTEKQFYNYYKFRFVRDPRDWLVTCWITAGSPGKFVNWVFTTGPKIMQGGTLFWRYNNPNIRTLFIDRDGFNFVKSVLDLPVSDLPRLGKIDNKPDWKDLLTVNQAHQLIDIFPDIERYQYES